MRQVPSLIMILILQAATAYAGPSFGVKAPEFTLQDQYEKTVSLRDFAGRVVVLIASDKEGSTQNVEWKKAIRTKYGNSVAVQGLADVSSVPFFLKWKIRNDFKKDAENILLDWKEEVFKAYEMAKGVSNVILSTRTG